MKLKSGVPGVTEPEPARERLALEAAGLPEIAGDIACRLEGDSVLGEFSRDLASFVAGAGAGGILQLELLSMLITNLQLELITILQLELLSIVQLGQGQC